MISEIIRDKKFQSRAFLLLPMTFNIGVIIGMQCTVLASLAHFADHRLYVGPILGGLLADPAGNYPASFGSIAWLKQWPYALPNIVSSVFLFLSATIVLLGLEEVRNPSVDGKLDLLLMCSKSHEMLRYKPDSGLRIGRWIARPTRWILRRWKCIHQPTSHPRPDFPRSGQNCHFHVSGPPMCFLRSRLISY
jgi:hypothetical protein